VNRTARINLRTLLLAAIAILCAGRETLAQCYTVQNATTFIVDGGTFGASGLAAGDCLNQAIRNIPNGGTIRLRNTAPGTGPFFIVRAPMIGTPESDERTGLPFIDKSVTIEAFGGAASPLDAIISADTTGGNVPDYRLFLVRGDGGQLTLNRVTVQNGRSMTTGQTNGGGIKHDSLNPLRLTDCIVRDNVAGTRGGGIWSQQTVICTNTRFIRNQANPAGLPGNPGEQIRGGALYHAPGKSFPETDIVLSLTNCLFRCNNSTEEGGAMWLGGGYQRRVNNCQFYGNTAVLAGGAMTASGTSFANTVPPVRLELTDCRFGRPDTANFACGDEPASPPNFGDAYGGGNMSGVDGGAVSLVDNAQPVFIRCTFENNRTTPALPSEGRGGAIYISSIGGNNSSLPRSAVFIESLFLRNQTFATGATPAGDGGAVFIRESSSPYFLDCGFIENNSRRGGGMNVIGGSNPRMYNCVFSRNSVAGTGPQGSAIWTSASSPQLLHCSLLSPIGSPLVWLNSTSATPMQLTGSIVWGNGPGGANRAFGGAGVVLLDPAVTANPQALYSDLDVDQPGRFADQSVDPTRVTNINCDPLVANAAINDVHLTTCSPAIDRASHALASSRYQQIFSVPMATFGFSFPLILGTPEGEQSDYDYDDPQVPPQGAFHNDATGPRPRTPRLTPAGGPIACEADMGADESPGFQWATLSVTCKQRSGGTCDAPVNLTDNASCSYCVGDNVVLDPLVTTSCPQEFQVVEWRRLSAGAPCPPGSLSDPLPGTVVSTNVPNSRFTVINGRLCIAGVQAADAGCYYAVLERRSCVGTNRGKFKAGNNINLPCVERVAACACITVTLTPNITAQPLPSSVCDGTPTTISVSASGSSPLCYQWYRRATPCSGTGMDGTLIPGATSSTLSFLPARARCPGEPQDAQDDNGYYYVIVSYCDGSGGSTCNTVTSTCARLTVFCPPAITGGGSVLVCGGSAGGAGGMQDCCYTITAPSGCTPVITWYKDVGQPGVDGDDLIVTSGSPAGVSITTQPMGNDQYQTCIVWNLNGLTPAQAQNLSGSYYIKAYCADPNCTTRSSNCSLTVRPQPVITVNPQDTATCEGSARCFNATVTYTGTTAMCWEWRRKPTCGSQVEGTVVSSGTWTPGQSLNFSYCLPSVQQADEQCYFFRIRVCDPNNTDKCPWVVSGCGCLDVRPQVTACVLPCDSGQTDTQGRCLYCPGARIVLCCTITSAEGPLCYQWQKQTVAQVGAWQDIPGQTANCLEIRSFDPTTDATCYRVRVNYSDLSGPNCPETSDRCNAAYSNPLCIAPTGECCEIPCPCKDNSAGVQEVYSVWHTGEWDGVNGEWSFDRSTTDGIIVKSADDFYLCPSAMHRITTFTGKMLVKQANPALALHAKLRIFTDCNGRPAELVKEFDSECAAFIQAGPDGFGLYQFQFFLDCFWLKGGTYWASLVAIAPTQDNSFEAFWVSTGLPGNPPRPTLLGLRPIYMEGASGPWQDFDPCCHPCADLQFCLIGESCPIIWDNGKPYLGGADAQPPGNPPFIAYGTRSEKSNLTARNSRAADQFVVNTCEPEEVCYIEGYIFTNCISFEAHLEIYTNDCRVPNFLLPNGTPYYTRVADRVVDLGYTGIRVDGTNVKAYKVFFCTWPQALTLQPSQNYWLSLSVRDTFSAAERAYFAHVRPPCDPCTTGNIIKIDPGKEHAPGRQIPNWRSADADFAFLVATKKHVDLLPAPPPGDPRAGECTVDLNGNHEADVADIFLFLSAWFTGCP